MHAGREAEAVRQFDWTTARAAMGGLPAGGLNIANEAVDRHVVEARGDRVAVRFVARDEAVRSVTYRDLSASAARFAGVLASLGSAQAIVPGADAASLLPDAPLREELGLDSLDFLGFIETLGHKSGAGLDDFDYADAVTLEDFADLVVARTGG